MNKKKFLTTGEFAKMCKTTKETLFHYDRQNLLKPKYVSENGYRSYGVEQFFDFDMIGMFKETGSTLKEIRTYIYEMHKKDFLTLLESKRLVAREERKKLAQREMLLDDMIHGTREALDFAYDTFMVLEQKEERLEVMPTTGTVEDSMVDFVERFAEYIDFYDKQKRFPRSPFGIILNQEDVLKGQYLESYYFSRATRHTPRTMLHVKPEGRYAVLAHRGTIQMHLQTFDKLLKEIKDAGLSVAGNCYCYDMMSYILRGLGERYAAKYCVLVE